MPDLNTTLHLDMLKQAKGQRSLLLRILKAIKREVFYGVFMALSGAIRISSPRSDSFEADTFSLTSRRTSAQ